MANNRSSAQWKLYLVDNIERIDALLSRTSVRKDVSGLLPKRAESWPTNTAVTAPAPKLERASRSATHVPGPSTAHRTLMRVRMGACESMPPKKPREIRSVPHGNPACHAFTLEEEEYVLAFLVHWLPGHAATCSLTAFCAALNKEIAGHHSPASWFRWWRNKSGSKELRQVFTDIMGVPVEGTKHRAQAGASTAPMN